MKSFAEVKLLILKLNSLCDNFLTQKDTFTDDVKIREIFINLKDMGYTFVTPRIEPTSKEFDYLSVKGKRDYRKFTTIRRKKMEAVKYKRFVQVEELREQERILESSLRTDYWNNNSKEYFRLINQITKEIVFNYYGNRFNECGDLGKFFQIQ